MEPESTSDFNGPKHPAVEIVSSTGGAAGQRLLTHRQKAEMCPGPGQFCSTDHTVSKQKCGMVSTR